MRILAAIGHVYAGWYVYLAFGSNGVDWVC
jgi:hypothetical protein